MLLGVLCAVQTAFREGNTAGHSAGTRHSPEPRWVAVATVCSLPASFRAVLAVNECGFHQKNDGACIQADGKNDFKHGSMGFVEAKIGRA